ncbi:MAG: TetR/AcrR family transcriptional regulator [Clostridia bacterium]|nr:TetR/AcrR family transcriptional regulator [Clostridia bacterium]
MKKGELKKQEILRTAEARFCRDGYEKTSIQDILDDLHTSKGSFYHHFVSKEALLEEICRNRAAEYSEQVFQRITEDMNPSDRLNLLIDGMIPFNGEKISFLLMLIPVFSGPEGIMIRNCYANELERLYGGKIADTLQKGTEESVYACSDPEFSAKMLSMLVNRFWLEICDQVLENEALGRNTDAGDLMSLTDNYRRVMERLISAPYGSLDLISLPEVQALTEQIHLHWKK